MADKKRKKTRRQWVKLMDPRYSIGWGTGLNAKEWREFAENYTPKNKELRSE